MISLPFRRAPADPTIGTLYGMIVAQARSPSFYRDYAVPDTVPGRMEMILLHLVLVLRRLRSGAAADKPVGQGLFDLFCKDMDDNFREMGVSDVKVPTEMRRVAEAFYGRAKVYDAALDDAENQSALIAALARNVFGAPGPVLDAGRLAAYVREAVRRLGAQDIVAAGRAGTGLDFPDPAAIAPVLSSGEPAP
jgi:cytochrome b pre-mRNA-processing protein 3